MNIELILRDCLEKTADIPDGSIDLTVTSPPYDNLRTYNGNNNIWGGGDLVWRDIIKDLFRVAKKGGVVVWIVGDATIKGSETGTSFRQALCAKECGFNLHDTMIFKKKNPIPLTHNRYEQAFEYMFVFSKGRPKTFNPLKEECLTSGSYTNRRNTGRVNESATRNQEEVTVTKKTKQRSNVSEYCLGSKKGETGIHPAPLQLAQDHITSWSGEGDTVFDPFMGSGTVGKVCRILDRNFIGIELDPEYFKIAQGRIQSEYAFLL